MATRLYNQQTAAQRSATVTQNQGQFTYKGVVPGSAGV